MLDPRYVLLSRLHQLEMQGAFLPQDDPLEILELASVNWGDGTSIFKGPLMTLAFGLEMDEFVFKKEAKSAVTRPMILAVSQAKELKIVYDVLLSNFYILNYRLNEPIVVMEERTTSAMASVDVSSSPDPIGDSHFGQASFCQSMSGHNTCTGCCAQTKDFHDMTTCLKADSKSFEGAREMIRSGEEVSWLDKLPWIFLGDAETTKATGESHVRMDFILHGACRLIMITCTRYLGLVVCVQLGLILRNDLLTRIE